MTMEQQDTGARDEASGGTPARQQPPPPQARPGADDTWGIGSSTALERLRERDYRGKRTGSDGKPSSQ